MKSVTLYTTEHCSFCISAKKLLAKRAIKYTEINLARDPDGRARLTEKTGMYTFPQIVVDGESLGGFQESPAGTVGGVTGLVRVGRGRRGRASRAR